MREYMQRLDPAPVTNWRQRGIWRPINTHPVTRLFMITMNMVLITKLEESQEKALLM